MENPFSKNKKKKIVLKLMKKMFKTNGIKACNNLINIIWY